VIRKLSAVICVGSAVLAPRLARAQGEAPSAASAAVAPDSIVVIGLRRVDRKQVLDQSGLTPGRPLGYRDVQRAIQTLYATGQFDDVRVAQDTAGGRQLLVVRLHERPILLKWAVRGVSRLSEGSVRDKAQLTEGRPVDPAAVARARGRIDSLYRAQGYYLAQVKVVDVFEADSARVRVIFDVDEGRRVAVARVTLDGPASGSRCLFDALSRMPKRPRGADGFKLWTKLPPGRYVVDRATQGERDFEVVLHRVRPKDEIPKAPAGHVATTPPGPRVLVLRKETIALARKLKFVGMDAVPVIACPKSLLSAWDREKDYDRACKASGFTLRVGKGQALITQQFPTAFVSVDRVGYLVIWVGADDGAHVLEAALSASPNAWKKTKQVFTMTGKQLALLMADQEKPAFVGTLAPGRYAIDQIADIYQVDRDRVSQWVDWWEEFR